MNGFPSSGICMLSVYRSFPLPECRLLLLPDCRLLSLPEFWKVLPKY